MSTHARPAAARARLVIFFCGLLVSLLGLMLLARGEGGTGVARAAAAGRILFGRSGDIWMAEDGATSPVTQGGRYWGQPDLAPDGSRIVLIGWGQNASDVFLLNFDGSDLRQLTRNQAPRIQDSVWAFFPRWSPDGQTIAYLSDRNSQYAMLWLMGADGSNARQITRARPNLDAFDTFAWAPDGSQIAATGFYGTQSQIYLIGVTHPDGPRALTSEPGGALDPTWSPDGRYVAYLTHEGRRMALKVVDTQADDPPMTLFRGETLRAPRWSPGGGAIAYLALEGSGFELFIIDLGSDSDGHPTAGKVTQVTNRLGIDAASGLSWGP